MPARLTNVQATVALLLSAALAAIALLAAAPSGQAAPPKQCGDQYANIKVRNISCRAAYNGVYNKQPSSERGDCPPFAVGDRCIQRRSGFKCVLENVPASRFSRIKGTCTKTIRRNGRRVTQYVGWSSIFAG